MELACNYFDTNMAVLKEHHRQVWEKVNAYGGEPTGEVCFAEDGNPNLMVRKQSGEELFLHDAKAPESELATYNALVPENTTGVAVFVGMGLGYSPLAIIQSRHQLRHLAVLEPKTGIFMRALQALDLRPLLADRRVVIGLGPDINVLSILAPMARALVLENVHLLNHIPSSHFHMEVYKALYDEVYKQGNTLNVGGATTRTFGRKFVDNRLRHLSAIHHQQLLEHLKDAFAGVPAIIVAGGPSLNKNIHLLSEAKGKAVIIAVDTVLPALLAHGVAPDFTTTIDMQDIVIEKIVDVSASATDTCLVCASWVSPTIPKNFPARQVYWTFAAKHMESWLNNLLGGTVLTSGAGTVAHLSFTTAILLGCSPIIFVGQDMAYTDRQDHAQLTSLSDRNAVNRLFETNEIQWVDGYGGLRVPTTRGWLSDKHHFERLMAATADRIFVNATEGGVCLEGTEEISLEKALAVYCRLEIDVTSVVHESKRPEKTTSQLGIMMDAFEKQLSRIAGFEKDMDRLGSVATKIKKDLVKLQAEGGICYDFGSLPMALKQPISELDALNSRLDKAQLWRLLDEVTLEGLLKSERLNHEIQQLEGKPERFLEFVSKNLERFVFINQCRREALTPFKQHLRHLLDYFHREHRLLKSMVKPDKTRWEAISKLLKLYYGNGDHVLVEKLIASHCQEHAHSAEVSFYLGAVAANQSQFDKAEQHFTSAIALDPSWSKHIAECRQRLGNQYFRFSQEWERNDQDVARRMLFKGIRHCADHPELRETLRGQVMQLLEEAGIAARKGALIQMADRLKVWCREMVVSPNLAAALGAEEAAALHRYCGNIMVTEQEYAQAAEHFAAAIALTPRAPDLHLLHSDAAFALGDFAGGIASLDRAVNLDRQYAHYWENMGDNLVRSGQIPEAIEAYTRCLLALPEHFGVLKKIGDCHLSMDQPHAAFEAYNHLKSKVQFSVNER